MKIRLFAAQAACFLLFVSCANNPLLGLFGSFDNKLDPDSGAYQGYRTESDVNNIDLLNPGNGADLTWLAFEAESCPNASQYHLQIASSADDLSGEKNLVLDKSDFTGPVMKAPDSIAVLGNTTYHWRVRARDKSGAWGRWSGSRTFTARTVLAAGSTVLPPEKGSVQQTAPVIDWPAVPDAAGYRIRYGTDLSKLDSVLPVSTAASSYRVPESSPLSNGDTVHWRVCPVNGNGVCGPWSGAWSFTVKIDTGITFTADMNSPATISFNGQTATLEEGLTMTVTASPSVAVESYAWYLDGTKISGAETNTVTVGSGLLRGTYCLYLVVVRNGVASSSFVRFEVVRPTLKIVSPAADSFITDRTPLLDWADKADVSTWRVQVSSSSVFAGTPSVDAGGLTASQYQVTTDLSAGTWYWRVSTDGGLTWFGPWSFSYLIPNAIAAGGYHTLALTNSGTLWAWGYNVFGQLGDGTMSDRSTPVQVLSGVSAVAAGYEFTLALKADGTLWAWGRNNCGQLGDDTWTTRLLSVQVLSGVSAVSAGARHTLALKADGTLWAWGENGNGQLGDGTWTTRLLSVQVLNNVSAVAAGGSHSLALKADGTLWAWGYNVFGQLGDGTTTNRNTPTQVLSDVSAVAAGGSHSLALKTDGTLWAWGHNLFGQLGDGTTNNRNTPTQVLSGVSAVAAGANHTLALKTDGTLWAWGNNYYWQLGNGSTSDRRTPVQVLSGVSAVTAGYYHSLALKTDGTLWAWGWNNYGQLGDGTMINRSMPVQIPF